MSIQSIIRRILGRSEFWGLHTEIKSFADKVERSIGLGNQEIAKRDNRILSLEGEKADIQKALDFLSKVKNGFGQ